MCVYALNNHSKYFKAYLCYISFWCVHLWCISDFSFDGSTQIWHQVRVPNIYFMVHPKKFISVRLVNTCYVGCNNCRCWTDTHLTFPKLSWTWKALFEIFLQILKLGFYLECKVSLGVWFLSKTIVTCLKICFTRIFDWEWTFISCHFQILHYHYVNFLQNI